MQVALALTPVYVAGDGPVLRHGLVPDENNSDTGTVFFKSVLGVLLYVGGVRPFEK